MKSPLMRAAAQIALLAVGLTAMLLGIFWDEASEVLNKAAIVCLECIGIG
jgi:hypothetical protein